MTFNGQNNILVVVLGRKVPVDWARADEVFTWNWDLLIVIWDSDHKLLFINSASNSGYYKKLAQAVGGGRCGADKGEGSISLPCGNKPPAAPKCRFDRSDRPVSAVYHASGARRGSVPHRGPENGSLSKGNILGSATRGARKRP